MRGVTNLELKEILQNLPDDVILTTNASGNFKVSKVNGDYYGYIDLNTKEFIRIEYANATYG